MGVCYSYILSIWWWRKQWLYVRVDSSSLSQQIKRQLKPQAYSTISICCWWKPSPSSTKKITAGRFLFMTGNRHPSSTFELTAVHFTTDGAKIFGFIFDRWPSPSQKYPSTTCRLKRTLQLRPRSSLDIFCWRVRFGVRKVLCITLLSYALLQMSSLKLLIRGTILAQKKEDIRTASSTVSLKQLLLQWVADYLIWMVNLCKD